MMSAKLWFLKFLFYPLPPCQYNNQIMGNPHPLQWTSYVHDPFPYQKKPGTFESSATQPLKGSHGEAEAVEQFVGV